MSQTEPQATGSRQDVDAERAWHARPFYLESGHWSAHRLFGSRERHWLHNDVRTGRFYAELFRYVERKSYRDNAVVLLAPAGSGKDYCYLQNVFRTMEAVHGVDLSGQALRKCPRPVQTREADILASGYADATFDVVVCAQFLHHVHAVGFEPFLREFYRLLKPGGTLAVLEPTNLYPIGWFTALARRCFGNVTGLVDNERPVAPRAVVGALRKVGFQRIRSRALLFTHVRVPASLQHLLDAVDLPIRVVPLIRNLASSFGWYCEKPGGLPPG